MVWVIIAVAAAAVVIFLFIEIEVRHRASLEGIDDPSAVRAYDYMSRTPGFAAMRAVFTGELKKHDPAGTLADVGCGPGYLLRVLAQNYPHLHLIGVDISSHIIEKAKRNLAHYRNIGFKVAGSHGLPFADNSLDFVVSTLSLHHWSKPRQAIEEFHRVLKPGGGVLIFDVRRNPPVLAHFLVRIITAVVVPGPLRRIKEPLGSILASYTPREVAAILTKTPFTDFSVKKGLFWLFAWGQK